MSATETEHTLDCLLAVAAAAADTASKLPPDRQALIFGGIAYMLREVSPREAAKADETASHLRAAERSQMEFKDFLIS